MIAQPPRFWPRVASWLGFYVVWFVAAIGAAKGFGWPAVAATVVYAALLAAGGQIGASAGWPIAVTTIAGLVAETVLLATGVISYNAQGPVGVLAPIWIVALWTAYGLAVETIAPRLRTHVGAIAGTALLAPLAYIAGAGLGALALPLGGFVTWVAIAVVWLAALALVAIADRRPDRMRG